MAKILVTGGAGYVGSSACAWLLDRGHEVHVLDDLSAGHRQAVLTDGFTRARFGDRAAVSTLLAQERFDCVMHFAGKALVAESVANPALYREVNVGQTRALLETMLAHGVRRFVFSSTCAIFGDPQGRPMNEDLPKNPINPYGQSKLEAEGVIREFTERGLQAVCLRYFNAAGAESGGRTGEWHEPETHLIPNVLKAALAGEAVRVFGNDYPTPDGTCVRDYVHVSDLAAAHESAVNRLLALDPARGSFEAFNLGSEAGYSVTEAVRACEKVIGKPVRVQVEPRRAGDPPRLVADSARARRELGFQPAFSLERIVETAWGWEKKRQSLRPAVFLDRDGTINSDPGYLSRPEQMQLLPGAIDALAALHRAGYLLVVISNQSGVGRGLIREADIPAIHARLDELLLEKGVKIDHYELCFHHPEDECACRKPKPKLILDAARKLGVNVERSFMVGDKISDVRAGRNAGCAASLLVRTGEGASDANRPEAGEADHVADDLKGAAEWIVKARPARQP
jgi:UDP-glucose 4-epimerase